MKVNKIQADANREALLVAAGALFRKKGINGVGVAEICKAAGLTHGALYSQFGSREDLAAEAFRHGQRRSAERMEKAIGKNPEISNVLNFYVSTRQRNNMEDCCPMLAAGSEAARQDEQFKSSYTEAFFELSATVGAAVGSVEERERSDMSDFIAACMIGVVSVSRGIREIDPQLGDLLLRNARGYLNELASIK